MVRRSFYPYLDHQKELFEIAKKTSTYAHDNSIDSVIFLDRAARPAHAAISTYWRLAFPDENMPQQYFINPALVRKYGASSRLIEMFQGVYKHLNQKKEKPTLIFDICIHSGKSLGGIIDLLTKSGFKDIHTGTVSKESEYSSVSPDFYVVKESLEGCYTFGITCLGVGEVVKKFPGMLRSERAGSKVSRKEAKNLRREIREVITEQYNLQFD